MIKFKVLFSGKCKNNILEYLEDECSFYMESDERYCDYELIVNQISMCVIDNQIVDLSGFCGLNQAIQANINVPYFTKGTLMIENSNEENYCVTDDDWKISVNLYSGWVCLGDTMASYEAVEFIDNCVAVINKEGSLVSLWLKPKSIPSFLLVT